MFNPSKLVSLRGLRDSASQPQSAFQAAKNDLVAPLTRRQVKSSKVNKRNRSASATVTNSAGNSFAAATDLGVLSSVRSYKDQISGSSDYYKFSVGATDVVSVFLNGLNAGHQVDLFDASGNLLRNSANSGTTWDAANSRRTGGTITAQLGAGTYYARVSSTAITGNPIYVKAGEYTVNFQLHNAPNTVTVAASDSPLASTADFVATGANDQTVINQAIAQMGNQGGGTVLLMEGTFNISNNVLVTYDNITLSGVGWSSVLRLSPNANLRDAGLLRSALRSESDNLRKPRFSNQVFKHMSLDGNKDQGSDYDDSYGNYGTYLDSSFSDMRVHDFPHYGFDPHENNYSGTPTVRLKITDSLSDHNAVDGLTTDNCLDSTFADNVLDSNGRHGINIVTATRNSVFENNVSTNNGRTGLTMQPGAIDLSRTSESNIIRYNTIRDNQREGMFIYRSRNSDIHNNTVLNNGRHGIRLRGTSYTNVFDNVVDNNGQSANDTYSGIYLDNDGTAYSTRNRVERNSLRSTTTVRYRYGFSERDVRDDANTYADNTLGGAVRKPYLIKGPNSTVS
jgi:parallel beta-helix repeat protein